MPFQNKNKKINMMHFNTAFFNLTDRFASLVVKLNYIMSRG